SRGAPWANLDQLPSCSGLSCKLWKAFGDEIEDEFRRCVRRVAVAFSYVSKDGSCSRWIELKRSGKQLGRGNRFDPVRHRSAQWEVFQIVGHDVLCSANDRGGQNVSVVWVRKR